MTNLERAFQEFQDEPNAINAWELQQAMVAYAQLYRYQVEKEKEFKATKEAKATAKSKPPRAVLKTKRGGEWCDRLNRIAGMFDTLEISIEPLRESNGVEAWLLSEKRKDQEGYNVAILYLSNDGFSIGKNKNRPLKGFFEGYDDIDTFRELLVCNDIEIE